MGLIDMFKRKAEEPKSKFGDCNLSAIEFVTKQLLSLLIDKRDEEEAKKYKPKTGDLIRLRLDFMDYICIEGDDNAPVACLDARDGVWRLESKEPQIFEKIWKADDFDTVVYSRLLFREGWEFDFEHVVARKSVSKIVEDRIKPKEESESCNGSTADFDSAGPGSNPGGSTTQINRLWTHTRTSAASS